MKITVTLKEVLRESFIEKTFYFENDSLIMAFEKERAETIQSIMKGMVEESYKKGTFYIKNISIEI